MAPEIIREEPYDEKVDIWSVGTIAYILLSGRPPFAGKSKPEIFNSITRGELQFKHPIWQQVSSEAKDFITKALHKDKAKRASAMELLSHPWIQHKVKIQRVQNQVQLDVANSIKQFKVIYS
jgi:serine/threonine protein kinase